MTRQFFIAILFLVTLTFPAWAEIHEVIIDDKGFHPEEIEVLSGDTVKWINKGTTVHSATGMDGGFDSGPLSPGLSYEHTFNGLKVLFGLAGGKISYADMKGGFKGKILFDNGTLEISPGDSKFPDNQKITMTIFFPSRFWPLSIVEGGGTVKVFYDGTLIFEGTMPQLANILSAESSGNVIDPYTGYGNFMCYITFSLPPFSLPPGMHQITIEAEYEGKKFQDSVTYTVFHRESATGTF